MRAPKSLSADYFVERYEKDEDPWNFATSSYERQKYATTLAALTQEHYGNALEVGCSIGIFTEHLSHRCTTLTAIDAADPALESARRRCGPLGNIQLQRCAIPGEWPAGRFDLIVFSEVLYYLDVEDLRRVVQLVAQSTSPTAEILLVHWTGETDYPLSGDQAADIFMNEAQSFTRVLLQSRTPQYRLDLLRRST